MNNSLHDVCDRQDSALSKEMFLPPRSPHYAPLCACVCASFFTSLVAVRAVGDVVVARMCGGFVIGIVDGDLCRSVEYLVDIVCD